jgi:hypothetical protein
VAINQIIKDSASTLDYLWDWSDWLGTDTISSVSWSVPPEIEQPDTHAPSNTATTATIWLGGLTDGGEAGTKYQLTCTITTAGGRIRDESIPVIFSS